MKTHRIIIGVILALMPLAMLMARPTVHLFRPSPGQWYIENLWKARVSSDSDYAGVWFEGFVFEAQKGQVFWAKTKPFALSRGTRVYQYKDVTVEKTDVAQGYEAFTLRTGQLPAGEYSFRLLLMPFGVGDSFTFEVRPMGPPRLISPRDGDTVKVKYPQFVWTPPIPRPSGAVTYELKLFEVLPGQTPEEATKSNPPWFEDKWLRATSLTYPNSAEPLEAGRRYAWRVGASGRGEKSVSVAWSFSMAKPGGPPALTEVVVNEVLFNPVGENAGKEWVELYNAGQRTQNLAGWTVSNRDAQVVAVLPGWDFPASAYLVVHFGPGVPDSDFSDGSGEFYTGQAVEVFDSDQDEVALCSGTPSTATIRDFVSWGFGSYRPGLACGYAVAAGIWPDSQAFSSGIFLEEGNSLGRNYFVLGGGERAADNNTPEDWFGGGGLDASHPTPGAANFDPQLGYLSVISPGLVTALLFAAPEDLEKLNDLIDQELNQIKEQHAADLGLQIKSKTKTEKGVLVEFEGGGSVLVRPTEGSATDGKGATADPGDQPKGQAGAAIQLANVDHDALLVKIFVFHELIHVGQYRDEQSGYWSRYDERKRRWEPEKSQIELDKVKLLAEAEAYIRTLMLKQKLQFKDKGDKYKKLYEDEIKKLAAYLDAISRIKAFHGDKGRWQALKQKYLGAYVANVKEKFTDPDGDGTTSPKEAKYLEWLDKVLPASAPPNKPVKDAGSKRIEAPGPQALVGIPVAPVLLVENYGRDTVWQCPVICRIDSAGSTVYQDSAELGTSLPPGDTAAVSFRSWTPSVPGAHYTVVFRTALPGDSNPGNDTVSMTVTVIGDSVNYPPTLSMPRVMPDSGDSKTHFAYTVTYTDADGDSATAHDVLVRPPYGEPMRFSAVSVSGSPKAGQAFQYQTGLALPGVYRYWFEFEDGHGHAVRTSETQGPVVIGR
jgi:hypothetical protein